MCPPTLAILTSKTNVTIIGGFAVRWIALAVQQILLSTAAGLLFAVAQHGGAAGQQTAASAVPSLYAKLGGYDFLAQFVDTAFPRVAADPQLAHLFRGHSPDSQMRQRQLIVDALCHYTGGPCLYIGRDLTTVHQGLQITGEDWTAFVRVISSALEELDVPFDTRREFLQLFEERFRPTVVVK